jgi:hypothetical protein
LVALNSQLINHARRPKFYATRNRPLHDRPAGNSFATSKNRPSRVISAATGSRRTGIRHSPCRRRRQSRVQGSVCRRRREESWASGLRL